VPRIDWSQARKWDFHAPDFEKFPLLPLAYESLRMGGTASCILNAADEVAVGAFLSGRISFPAIASVVKRTLDKMPLKTATTVAEILEADADARRVAQNIIQTSPARVPQGVALAEATQA